LDKEMTNTEILDILLHELIAEKTSTRDIQIPADSIEKRNLLRALMNTRPPLPMHPDILKLQDQLLAAERDAKPTVNPYDLHTIKTQFGGYQGQFADKLVLWKGDITTLTADAIVNAANSKLLGCFAPLHSCIDNVIHSTAGIQLRLECNELMQQQGFDEPTGQAKITKAYNLPAKYVLHTVGPIIGDTVTTEDEKLLSSCYTACLDLAREKADIHTLAFCCISTGVFRFPKAQAARIAVTTVCNWLQSNPDRFDRIIFNVFLQEDFDEYSKLFRQA
jgi:O-acetyl-ADP-ribose deacetylase (regulator of RNase III)